jgi:hypothetical protein
MAGILGLLEAYLDILHIHLGEGLPDRLSNDFFRHVSSAGLEPSQESDEDDLAPLGDFDAPELPEPEEESFDFPEALSEPDPAPDFPPDSVEDPDFSLEVASLEAASLSEEAAFLYASLR